MDSIDIADSAFSLANVQSSIVEQTHNVIESITNQTTGPEIIVVNPSYAVSFDDFTWFYLGIILIILAIALYIYKTYITTNRKQVKFTESVQDCPGGFCTMEQCSL